MFIRLSILGGIHRLPPITSLQVKASGGRTVVGADRITWTALTLTQVGTFVLAGTGWEAWDNR